MKSVLISIQPKWCELIASSKKTVEVRKTRPKIPTPFKCYIYCTKEKKPIRNEEDGRILMYEDDLAITNRFDQGKKIANPCGALGKDEYLLNGKVIGEFVCDEITDIYSTSRFWIEQYEKPTCLTSDDIRKYATGEHCYGWHISDLVIYDKPRELSEFEKAGALSYDDWLYGLYNGTTQSTYENYLKPFRITRAPQSWCYVEEVS